MADKTFAIQLILILLAIIILIVLIMHYNKTKKSEVSSEDYTKKAGLEKYQEPTGPIPIQSNTQRSDGSQVASKPSVMNDVMPSEPQGNEDYKAVDFVTDSKLPSACFPRDRNTLDDLLPKDAANSLWAQVNPAGQGDVKDQNFLTPGFDIGMNTVGQSLRNANYQLRSDPYIPRTNVGPWNQSTIEPDTNRRYFEIGEC